MPNLTGNTLEAPRSAPDYTNAEFVAGPDGGRVIADAWWESESTGNTINVLCSTGDDPQIGGYPTVAYRWASNALRFSEAGLEPVLQSMGVAVESRSSAEHTGYTEYWLSTPRISKLVERANDYPYSSHLGRRMRFEGLYKEMYSYPEFFEAMAEGRMLIPVVGDNPWIKFHDVGDHMVVGLALSSELVDALAQRSRHILNTPGLMAELQDDNNREGNFLALFDRGLFSSNFLDFLHEDETELRRWTKILDIDMETARGYAIRARKELHEIGATSQQAIPTESAPQLQAVTKRQTWIGSLLRRWLPLPR